MPELIWVREEGGTTEYADHGRFRASITLKQQPGEERATIRYVVRDLETGVEEQASYLQVAADRAGAVFEATKRRLEADLMSRPGDDVGSTET